MENLGKLYSQISKHGLYTNSFDDFLGKYKNSEYQKKVYDKVSKYKFYIGGFEEFKKEYPLNDQTDQTQSKQIDTQKLDLSKLDPKVRATVKASVDVFYSPGLQQVTEAATAETEAEGFFDDVVSLALTKEGTGVRKGMKPSEAAKLATPAPISTPQHTELLKEARAILSKDGKTPTKEDVKKYVKKLYIQKAREDYTKSAIEELLEEHPKMPAWGEHFKSTPSHIYDIETKKYRKATEEERMTEGQRVYAESKKEMVIAYEKRKKVIGEENAKRAHILDQTEQAITDIEDKLQQMKAKSETTQLTTDEINMYRELYAQHQIHVNLFQKTLEEYSNGFDKIDDFNTLVDMTRRTYDNIDVAKNRLNSRWLQVKAGLLDISEFLPSQVLERTYGIELDEENKESIKTLLDEKGYHPGNIPWFTKIILESDKAYKKISITRDKFYEESEKINQFTEKRQEFGKISSLEDFAEFTLDLFSEQALNTAITASLGTFGLGLVAASAAGNKFNELRKDIVNGENISAMQFYTAGLIYGLSEYITEKVALDQFMMGKRALAGAFNLEKGFGKYTIKQFNFFTAAKKYGVNVNKEGSAELFASLGQNWADKHVLKRDISMTQGLKEAYITGAIMSGLGFQAPVLVSDVYRAFSPKSSYEIANKNSKQVIENTLKIKELKYKQINNKDPKIQDAITKLTVQNEELLIENLEAKKAAEDRMNALTTDNKRTLLDLESKSYSLRSFMDKTNANENLSKKQRGDLLKRTMNQLNNLEAKKEVVLASAQYAKGKKDRSKRQNDAIIKNNLQDKVQNVEADNAIDALKQINKLVDESDLSPENKAKLKQQTAMDFVGNFDANGATVGAEFNLPITVQLKSNATVGGNSTVHSHEFGHATFFRKLKDSGVDIVNMVNMLEDHVAANYKEAYKVFQQIKDDAGYKNKTAEQIAEEQFMHLSDFARQTNLQADRTLQNKLLTSFKKIFASEYRKPGGLNNEIKTGEDVFNLLTSFNTYFETGEVSTLLKAAFEGKLDVKKLDKKSPPTKGAVFSKKFKDTRSNKVIAKQNAEINKQIYEEDVRNKDGELIVSDSLRDDLIDNNLGKVYKLARKAANNPNVASLEKGKRKKFKDFFQEYYTELDQLTRTYRPENTKGDFGAYMMQNLEKRYGGVLGRLKAGEVKGKKTSVDTSEARGVADTTESVETKLDKKRRNIEKVSKKVLSKEFGFDKIDKAVAIEMKKKGFKMPKSIKDVKDLHPRLTAQMFGIKDIDAYVSSTKKIGKADVIRAKKVIQHHAALLHAVALLEGTTRGGKSTGTRNVLLKTFFTKFDRVKSKETGSTQGLGEQVKQPFDQKEFLKAFMIAPGLMMKVDGQYTANLVEAMIDATGKTMRRQAIKKELLKNEETRENALLIQGIEDGKSEIAFSKRLKDQSSQNKMEILDQLDNQSFYNKFDEAKKELGVGWLKSLIINEIDPNTLKDEKTPKKELGKELNRIKNDIIAIAEQLEHEVTYNREAAADLKEGFSETEFLSATFQNIRDEDVQVTLSKIAEGKGHKIRTHSQIFNTVEGMNQKRKKLLKFFKDAGYSRQFVKKYLLHGYLDPGHFGKWNLPTGKIGLKIKSNQVKEHSSDKRWSLFATMDDATNNFLNKLPNNPNESSTLRRFMYTKDWYVKPMVNRKKNNPFYKVDKKGKVVHDFRKKKFDDLNARDKKIVFDIIKNEGFKHKKALAIFTEDLSKAYASGQLTAEDVFVFVDLQGAHGTGLIRTSAHLMAVPTMSKAEIIKTFGLDPTDPYVLEHLIPQIRISGLTYNYILSAKESQDKINKAKILLGRELSVYGVALTPKAYQDLIDTRLKIPNVFDEKTQKFKGQDLYKTALPGPRKVGEHPLGPSGRTLGLYGRSVFPIQLTDYSQTWGQPPATVRNESPVVANYKEASVFSKKLDKKSKGMSIIDFDDTLAVTDSKIHYQIPRRLPNGGFNPAVVGWGGVSDTGSLTPAEFAQRHAELEAMGAVFDYSEFNKVIGGKKGPFFDKAKALKEKFGNQDIYILSARPPSSAFAIQAFLKGVGLDIKLENIIGLEDGAPKAKADWIVGKIAEGYNDVLFADDQKQNVKAVKEVFDTFDIKGKVHQSRTMFSKKMSDTFNEMIEETTGIKSYKGFSIAEARARGKNTFKWSPPGAEDFLGLLYPFFSKGKKGDAQMKIFKKWLSEPFARGFNELNKAKQELRDRFDNLVDKEHKGIKTLLGKESGVGAFSNEHAVKMYLWDKYNQDYSETGITKTSAQKLIDTVKNNKALKDFADDLGSITNLKTEYVPPSGDWMNRGVQQDMLDVSNKINRKIYFKEFIENKNFIFNEKNLNKIEAIFGSNHRFALEDMLYRMEHGVRRNKGMDPAASWFMKWWSSATSTIMFFNRKSAMLQSLSMFNFVNLKDNNPFQALRTFGSPKQFLADFKMLWNSPMLKQRRRGLNIDVNFADMIDNMNKPGYQKTMWEKLGASKDWLLNKGFFFTKTMDNFAIAFGGATMYRNRVNTYLKQGLTQEQAEKKAFRDFQEVSEPTQQSTRADLISQQQASVYGRFLLAFQNVSMQNTRNMKKAITDIIKGRGDFKTNLSKIIWYGGIQNAIFITAQNGLMMLWSGADDDEKKKRGIKLANGMVDVIMRGSGIVGGLVSVLKNVLLKYAEESGKGYKADNAKIILEGLNMSPPISSKFRKAYNAAQERKFSKHDEWSTPYIFEDVVKPTVLLAESLTNAPFHEAYETVDDALYILDQNHSILNKFYVGLGYPQWVVEKKEETKSKKKKKKKSKIRW